MTGIDSQVLSRASRLDLLDSPLHAPQAGFGDEDFYPNFPDKAAVLVVRIARNHPLPDGNKRLAWQSLTMFCALNGMKLEVPVDDAVTAMLAVAAGELDERAMAVWLARNPSFVGGSDRQPRRLDRGQGRGGAHHHPPADGK